MSFMISIASQRQWIAYERYAKNMNLKLTFQMRFRIPSWKTIRLFMLMINSNIQIIHRIMQLMGYSIESWRWNKYSRLSILMHSEFAVSLLKSFCISPLFPIKTVINPATTNSASQWKVVYNQSPVTMLPPSNLLCI